MDGTKNEVEGIEIDGFPTFFLYRKGEKNHKNAVEFEDTNVTLSSLIKFLENNTRQTFSINIEEL